MTSTAGGHHTWDSDQIDVEGVSQTGAGVYVAVLDTGLVPNYRDYFPKERVAAHLGAGFEQQVKFSPGDDPCDLSAEFGAVRRTSWVGSTGSTHGTHVSSTILGYFYRSNFDLIAGFPLPPIIVRGIAPDVTVIPVKVLADYQVPARPKCTDPGPLPSEQAVFGTDAMVAAGIDYVAGLADAGYEPIVINMSLGGPDPSPVIEEAVDRAIDAGVVVVASAGNEGEDGMGWPGAYPQVISAGAAGWTGEWLFPDTGDPRYRMWWLQDMASGSLTPPLQADSGDVADPTSADDVYVTDFSSRAIPSRDQELDVLAPGSWVRGPFPGFPGYAHLPWHSRGIGDLVSRANPGNFFYVGGTSMASPHVASAAALILEKNSGLDQTQVESILKASAFTMPASGTRSVFDITATPPAIGSFVNFAWDADCAGDPCDAVGAGLLQVDAAVGMTPAP